jgi:hypothetical protein
LASYESTRTPSASRQRFAADQRGKSDWSSRSFGAWAGGTGPSGGIAPSRPYNPKLIHLKKFPYKMLARTVKRVAAEAISSHVGPSARVLYTRCKKSDTQVAIEFVDAEQARAFMKYHNEAGTQYTDPNRRSYDIEAQFDAPFEVRQRNWVLSLLWEEVHSFIAWANLLISRFRRRCLDHRAR